MGNIMESVEFNYITDVDVPMLEQHFINRWQKRAKKLNTHKQDSLNKRLLIEKKS